MRANVRGRRVFTFDRAFLRADGKKRVQLEAVVYPSMTAIEPTPLFSIIVPTHGRRAFLAEALASVPREQRPTSKSWWLMMRARSRLGVPADPRFRLIRREQNGGVAAARNSGLREARGTYVAFLDDDDAAHRAPIRLAVGLEGLARVPISICQLAHLGEVATEQGSTALAQERESAPGR